MMKRMFRNHRFAGRAAAAAILLCGAFCMTAALPVSAAQPGGKSPGARGKGGSVSDANKEYDAQNLLKKGMEYLELQQEERGIKTISQVSLQYPGTRAAFQSDVVLGNYYIEKKQYDLAVKRLQRVAQNEDPEIQAEALYKMGICHFNSGEFNQAFVTLRQVVNKYPGSIYANEAYYYIGLCHFSLSRWTQAVDSLERVGTSVNAQNRKEKESPDVTAPPNLAEAGQRVFIRIADDDLVVLTADDPKAKLKVKLSNQNGDEETVELEAVGRDGTIFIGSVPSQPGEAVKGDGVLQTRGGDVLTVHYTDMQTASGKTKVDVAATIPLVSTATVVFTTGSYEDSTSGIFAGQDFFIRVRDLDRDTTPNPDTVTIRVSTMYKEEKEEDLAGGIRFDEKEEPEYKVRDVKEFTLTETGPRTGVFTCTSKTELVTPAPRNGGTDPDSLNPPEAAGQAPSGPQTAPASSGKYLKAASGDVIQIEYQDDAHAGGMEAVTRLCKARVIAGEITNVLSQSREVNDLTVKARKNLIEGKILLHLAQIFKDVGLTDYANERAKEGIEKIDEVLKINSEAALEHRLLEDAFNTKWELLIVQNKIREAIAVCSMLIKMFPESALVDQALMKIAEIKIREGGRRAVEEGLNIYRGILQLPQSPLKPEAQYRIAEVMMNAAIERAKENQLKFGNAKPNYGPVMLEYKKCADNYPDSTFAGKALEKIADFYIEGEDYQRVLDMMEQLFRDYPDADFLDKMLYKWASAALKLGRFELANEKCEQLMSEYPNSPEAKRALQLRKLLRERVSTLNEE